MNERGPRREEAFVAWLESLTDDRAALARLRRSLGRPPGLAYEADRYVVPFLRSGDDGWAETAYYLVAGLFALHPSGSVRQGSAVTTAHPPEARPPAAETPEAETPEGRPPGRRLTFGASLAILGDRVKAGREGIERRFLALAAGPAADLPDRLRPIVTQMRGHDVPVDYAQLLRDLRRWDQPDRHVQHRWARDFWRAPAPAANDTAPVDPADPEGDADRPAENGRNA